MIQVHSPYSQSILPAVDRLGSVVAERSIASDSSSGVVRMWVRVPGMAGHGACVLEQDTKP